MKPESEFYDIMEDVDIYKLIYINLLLKSDR